MQCRQLGRIATESDFSALAVKLTQLRVSPMAKGVKTKPPGTLWTGPSADGPFARRANGVISRELSAVTLTLQATCGVGVPRG